MEVDMADLHGEFKLGQESPEGFGGVREGLVSLMESLECIGLL